MTTIDITEHLAQFTATGLIVVDGQTTTGTALPGQLIVNGTHAPAQWHKLTDPCNQVLCVSGRLITEHAAIDVGSCPNCVGGRQVVTLTARCHKFISHFGATWHYEDGRLLSSTSCDSCTNGEVTLGRFTINLIQVPLTLDDAAVEDQQILNAMNTVQILNLSKAQTGQWVIEFKKVES